VTLFEPSPTTDFLVGVVGPAVVAVAGVLAARRRQAGRWRTVLTVGLVAAGLVPALWWWSPWQDDTGVITGGWFGYDEAGFDTFTRALWFDLLFSVVKLAAFAAVVAAAVLGRPPASAEPGREAYPD